ncbi:MAG: tRNA (adenosine(37)-N6)-threonylcarbamoyltransferase complex ATPase subunit type 1 TsaE [Deltaproteobacteria bacterium CG_4_8_14_3_um_filter_45_9]|jgi:tRNA threonylcarbamoyladenosine biosynthesis protein TsaE|nr:MAG: tRNA (adenosine(37)-N6)-threonylcarbamoyltransferase complex ATPase subunit type 1 TsaE [Deltaproteobacteria bacterium CG03_land_8_20_14_0_80_45_14]PIX23694.1 MAG: tRNA (adenosine(37)-N6)-threonylcarbamoyltransferase complex ATPase subunit type 1 TsaE [Deltaproteobacteria bacterium CG_4_8_14_3_um_filter_45_9]
MVIQTKSASETIRIGESMGSRLLPGDVVALVGELGAGKTQFIKGLAAGVGIGNPTYISSPSFTLINEYPGRVPFYHIDLFRLEREKEAQELGLEDYFQGEGIAAIEWADKIPSLLPKEMLLIHIAYTGKNTRSLEIIGKGNRFLKIVGELEGSRIQGVK